MANGVIKLHCTNCGYSFTPKGTTLPERCPYCDKTGTLRKAKDMQDWIDEVVTETSEREEKE